MLLETLKIFTVLIIKNYNENYFVSASSVKEDICRQLTDEAEANLGCAMTFTLIEWVKEHLEELLANQPETVADSISNLELEDKVRKDLPRRTINVILTSII